MRLPEPERWAQLSPLLDELLDLEPEAQAARLAQVRDSDPSLAAELHALLEHGRLAAASGLLTGSAGVSPLGETSLAGQRIGAYRLDALIGEGGSGAVWRGHRDDGQFEGTVAIKLLHMAWVGRAAAERFRREGTILARLAHPNIARMLDAGVTPNGQPYLVLELVEGLHLDVYADAHRLGIEQRLALFGQVLEALAHAQSHLVIHRDIKPSNIVVAHDGTVKLLDFGIAKLTEEQTEPGTRSDRTRDGAQALTPEFAAPEQLNGEPVTTATDVYALGVVLYQLLAGVHPTAQARASAAQLIVATIEAQPTLLSSAVEQLPPADALCVAERRSTTPQRLARQLRGDLSNIVALCLRKAPHERYRTAAALGDDLRRHIAHEPVRARADSFMYRAVKFARKHRTGVVLTSVVALALVCSTGVTSWQMIEARHQREEAVAQAAKAEASANFLDLMVNEVGADGGMPTPRQMLDRGLYLLDHSPAGDPRFMVDQLVDLGSRYSAIDYVDGERQTLARAEALARSVHYDEGLAAALCMEVRTELTLGKPAKAQERFKEAQGIVARLQPPKPLVTATWMLVGADLDSANGHPADAIAHSQQALDLLQSTGNAQNSLIITALANLSKFNSELGNVQKAFEYRSAAMAALDRTGRGGSVSMLIVMSNEATNLANFGEPRRALERYDELLKRYEARGASPANRIFLNLNRAITLSTLARHDEALALLDQTIAEARASKNLRVQQLAQLAQARACVRAGHWAQGRDSLDQIEAAYQLDAAKNKRGLQGVALARAELHLRTGDILSAQAGLDALLKDTGYPATRTSWVLRGALPLAAEVALAQKQPERAEALGLAAADFATRQARDPEQSADVGRSMVLVARARRAAGNIPGALEALQSAIPKLEAGYGKEHPAVQDAHALLDDLRKLQIATR